LAMIGPQTLEVCNGYVGGFTQVSAISLNWRRRESSVWRLRCVAGSGGAVLRRHYWPGGYFIRLAVHRVVLRHARRPCGAAPDWRYGVFTDSEYPFSRTPPGRQSSLPAGSTGRRDLVNGAVVILGKKQIHGANDVDEIRAVVLAVSVLDNRGDLARAVQGVVAMLFDHQFSEVPSSKIVLHFRAPAVAAPG